MFHSHKLKGTFRPIQDYVLLRPIKEPETTKGGILLPASARQYGRCEVLSTGPGRRTDHGELIPCELKVGQFVFIQKFVEGELKFNLNGDDVYVIRERHVNCTIEDEIDIAKRRRKKAA